MATGTIAKIIDDKGFGFIAPADGGDKDLFFHARSVVGDVIFDDMCEGDTVTYEVEEGPKGLAAVDVEKTDAAPAAAEEAPATEEAPAEEAAPAETSEEAPEATEEEPAA